MTEAEWLVATDPKPMLEVLKGKTSQRKILMLYYAWFWAIRSDTMTAAERDTIVVAELAIDGLFREEDRQSAENAVRRILKDMFSGGYSEEIRPLIADLFRHIFGNPFRPIALNHSWLTSTVLALANGIYSEKAFDRMPILADALQDAGCENAEILNHCRQPGDHCRGCWVVDLVLGKT